MSTTEEMDELYYDLYCALRDLNKRDNTPNKKLDMGCGCGYLMSEEDLLNKIKDKEKYNIGRG